MTLTLKRQATFLVVPTVLILALIVIFPLLFSLYVAVTGYDIRIPEHPFVGIGNFKNLLKQSDFYNSLYVTGTLIVVELIIELLLGLILALLLLQLPGARKFFQPILLIPMMVMPVVIGYVGRLVFEVRSGPINYFLNLLGFESLQWHASPTLALITVLILRLWQWTPFVMAVLLAGLLSLPVEPYDSAQVDGASAWQTFRYLTVPMLRPVITLVVIMRTLEILQTFDIIYVLTMGGPGSRTMTVSLYTYLAGFRYWDVGMASAAAWFMMIPLSFLITLFVKFMEKGEQQLVETQ
ncbi:ABC transporter, membrane spanning protein (Sugar) [Candidatus Vecturithrix granuli]|uniref:ABC transporter, membrane spanning protein (Sugar) n=1 Tax=Vecturithrix granuli TaxID=1499967 RepID=A0A081C4P1_VECG1|nr:ABC transporter, membrane spanning protein (Sugar) [Candidatus Vecturithrix granuli]